MAQTLLELECPGCTAQLELDPGFAGGVCRCSICGTLMTVPADPLAQPAERLSRPDSPGGRPAAPTPPTEASPAPRPDAPGRPAAPPAAAAPEPDDEPVLEAQSFEDEPAVDTYVTETGRVVEVDRAVEIPTAAKKRPVVRATTAVIFFAIVAGVLALMVFALVMLISEPPPPDTSHVALQQFEYTRGANPWTMPEPNVLGLPLGERCVVVVDASKEAEPWIDTVRSAISAGLTRADSKTKVNLVYATRTGVEKLSGGPTAIGGLSASRLESFQEDQPVGGEPELFPALAEALEMEPASIILITGRRARSVDQDRIRSAIEANAVLLDVVSVYKDDPGFERMATNSGGRYIKFLTSDRFDQWQADAGN